MPVPHLRLGIGKPGAELRGEAVADRARGLGLRGEVGNDVCG
jgi:hypothetical protein